MKKPATPKITLLLWGILCALLSLKLECRILHHAHSQIQHHALSNPMGLGYFALLTAINLLFFLWVYRKGVHVHKREPMGFGVSLWTTILLGLGLEWFLINVYPNLPIPSLGFPPFSTAAGNRMKAHGVRLKDWRVANPAGYTHFPVNSTAFWYLGKPEDADFVNTYEADENGLKNPRGVYQTTSVFDCLTVGDSFTEGFGTSIHDSWPMLLASRFQLKVYNLGGGGDGPLEERAIVEALGFQKRSRYLLWGFLEGNDFEDAVASAEKKRLLLEPDRSPFLQKLDTLQKIVSPIDQILVLDLPMALARVAVRGFRGRVNQGVAEWRNDKGNEYIPFHYYDKDVQTLLQDPGYLIFQKELLAVRDAAKARGTELILLFFPNKAHAYRHAMPEKALAPIQRFLPNMEAKHEVVLEFCRRNHIPVIDLVPAFTPLPEPQHYYFRSDGHMNARGNSLVAETVGTWLRHYRKDVEK